MSKTKKVLTLQKVAANKFELMHLAFNLFDLLEIIEEESLASLSFKQNQCFVIEAILKAPDFKQTPKDIKFSKKLEKSIRTWKSSTSQIPELWIVGDKMRMKQLLLIFITNGIKFTPNGKTTLRVEITPQKRKLDDLPLRCDANANGILLNFSIIDEGAGMNDSQFESLFKPFTTLPYSKFNAGTGLGTAISQKLINLMQGSDIRIETCDDPKFGAGSSFSFEISFPLSEQKLDNKIPKLEEFGDQHPSCVVRLLSVDDDHIGQKIFPKILSGVLSKQKSIEFDVQTQFAASEKEALAQIEEKNFEFDLICMDQHLQNSRTGLEIAQRIRELESSTNPIPIILCTGDSSIEMKKKELFESRIINGLIFKPICPYDVEQAMQQIGFWDRVSRKLNESESLRRRNEEAASMIANSSQKGRNLVFIVLLAIAFAFLFFKSLRNSK